MIKTQPIKFLHPPSLYIEYQIRLIRILFIQTTLIKSRLSCWVTTENIVSHAYQTNKHANNKHYVISCQSICWSKQRNAKKEMIWQVITIFISFYYSCLPRYEKPVSLLDVVVYKIKTIRVFLFWYVKRMFIEWIEPN